MKITDLCTADMASYQPVLLGLPTELRLTIFDYVFCNLPFVFRPWWPKSFPLDCAKKAWIPPPILRCCRALRYEGMGPFRDRELNFVVTDLDASQLIAYVQWTGMMSSYYPDDPKYARRFDFLRLEWPVDWLNAHSNLLRWVNGFFNGTTPAYLFQEDAASDDKYTVAPLVYHRDPPFSRGFDEA